MTEIKITIKVPSMTTTRLSPKSPYSPNNTQTVENIIRKTPVM